MIKTTKIGHYYYKDGILRLNRKTKDEWKNLFSQKFEVLRTEYFTLVDSEKDFPRILFLLKKSI